MLPTFDAPEKRNCAALLAFVSLLWCLEAVPLFVTSMIVPVLVVILRVLVDTSDPQHPRRLTPKEAAPHIFHAMFSQVRCADRRPGQSLHLACGGHAVPGRQRRHLLRAGLGAACRRSSCCCWGALP